MKVHVDGVELELYTIGYTAKVLKKSVETLRAWEREKVIPRPMYKNRNVRLYHPAEVDAMRKVIKKLGKHARKKAIRVEMWTVLKEVRAELLRNGTQEKGSS
jgi:hypothetical protein